MKNNIKTLLFVTLALSSRGAVGMLLGKSFSDLDPEIYFPETKEALEKIGSLYDPKPLDCEAPLDEISVMNNYWKAIKDQRESFKNAALQKFLSLKISKDSYPELRYQYAAAMYVNADPNTRHDEECALIHAARMQDFPLCKLLLEQGADPNTQYELTPVLFFVKTQKLAQLFLDYKTRFTLLDVGGSLLMQAMEHDYEPELAELYLEKGVSVFHTDYRNGTALHRLAYKSCDYKEKLHPLFRKAFTLLDELFHEEALQLIGLKQYSGCTALDILKRQDSHPAQLLAAYLESHFNAQKLDATFLLPKQQHNLS